MVVLYDSHILHSILDDWTCIGRRDPLTELKVEGILLYCGFNLLVESIVVIG